MIFEDAQSREFWVSKFQIMFYNLFGSFVLPIPTVQFLGEFNCSHTKEQQLGNFLHA